MAYVIPVSPHLKRVLNQLAEITKPAEQKKTIKQDNKKQATRDA